MAAPTRPVAVSTSTFADPSTDDDTLGSDTWTESLADDGLFAFDPAIALTNSKTELIGFVGMHLDFIIFHDRLLANIKVAVLILLALLIAFALYGRRALRRALRREARLRHTA